MNNFIRTPIVGADLSCAHPIYRAHTRLIGRVTTQRTFFCSLRYLDLLVKSHNRALLVCQSPFEVWVQGNHKGWLVPETERVCSQMNFDELLWGSGVSSVQMRD